MTVSSHRFWSHQPFLHSEPHASSGRISFFAAGDLTISSEGIGKGCTVVATMKLPIVPSELLHAQRGGFLSRGGDASTSDSGDGATASTRGIDVGIPGTSSYARSLLQIRSASRRRSIFPQHTWGGDSADAGGSAEGSSPDPEKGVPPVLPTATSTKRGETAMASDSLDQQRNLGLPTGTSRRGVFMPAGGSDAGSSSFASTSATDSSCPSTIKQAGIVLKNAPVAGGGPAARGRHGGAAGVIENDPRLVIVRVLAAEDDPMMRCGRALFEQGSGGLCS